MYSAKSYLTPETFTFSWCDSSLAACMNMCIHDLFKIVVLITLYQPLVIVLTLTTPVYLKQKNLVVRHSAPNVVRTYSCLCKLTPSP